MVQFPNDYKYSKEHTWVKVEGETGIIGITEFAQSGLGEIVYVDLPDIEEFALPDNAPAYTKR